MSDLLLIGVLGYFQSLFHPEQLLWKAESGQEITWNINFTWLLLGRHLKIDHVNCHPASDDYFLIVIGPVLLWLTVMLLGYFNLWISWSNSLYPHMPIVLWINKCVNEHLWENFFPSKLFQLHRLIIFVTKRRYFPMLITLPLLLPRFLLE